MIQKFSLEFILHAKNSSLKAIKSSLAEFGDGLTISDSRDQAESGNYNVSLITEEPALIFDICSQFGRIRSIKVNELDK